MYFKGRKRGSNHQDPAWQANPHNQHTAWPRSGINLNREGIVLDTMSPDKTGM